MTKVSRVVLVDGDCHEISCAVLGDGVTSPVVELLQLLDQGVWPDPEVTEYPDEYQPKLKSRFLALVDYLAQYGELEDSYNRLREGIWEFKVEGLRVTFFDTTGDGYFTPKEGTNQTAWNGKNKYILPTDFDNFIRVGHYFAKDGQKTKAIDISKSIQTREEDLAHDILDEEQDFD